MDGAANLIRHLNHHHQAENPQAEHAYSGNVGQANASRSSEPLTLSRPSCH